MVKIALNIICKNESHIIQKMLNSAKPVVDLIVAVDTGSTDHTGDIIRQFGQDNHIPVFVHERSFDNFCNSRNYALDKLLEALDELGWSPEDVMGFSLDCDELVLIMDEFDKDNLSESFYHIVLDEGGVLRTKIALYRMSKKFRWVSPVHEVIVWEDPEIKAANLDTLAIRSDLDGSSWKKDVEGKFLHYGEMLAAYADEGHEDFRTLFNTADSYQEAAMHAKSEARGREHRSVAIRYFERAIDAEDSNAFQKGLAYNRIASNMIALKEDWATVREILFSAHALDPGTGESAYMIINYYMETKQWELAYLFSSFAKQEFDQRVVAAKGHSVTRPSLYEWEFLLYNYMSAYLSGRRSEARALWEQLTRRVREKRAQFSPKEIGLIYSHSPLTLKLRQWKSMLLPKRA